MKKRSTRVSSCIFTVKLNEDIEINCVKINEKTGPHRDFEKRIFCKGSTLRFEGVFDWSVNGMSFPFIHFQDQSRLNAGVFGIFHAHDCHILKLMNPELGRVEILDAVKF